MTETKREDVLADLLDAIPHIVWMTDEDGRPTYFNAQWKAYTGSDLEATRRVDGLGFLHPDDQAGYRASAEAGRTARAPYEVVHRLLRHDGTYRLHRCRVVPLTPGKSGAWAATATDIDDEQRLEEQQKFLIEAGKRLGATLDSKATLRDVAKLLVPHLADWITVDLLGDNGIAERVAMAHVDPTKVDMAWEFWRRMPPKPDDPGGIYGVMRTGAPEVFSEISDELLVQAVPDPESLALIRNLGLRSSMCVPLVAGERTVGALTLVSAESQRSYGDRDLAFATSLAGRIAIAVENARLFEDAQQARVASEAIAAEVIEQSRAAQELVLAMRRERDEALAKVEMSSGR